MQKRDFIQQAAIEFLPQTNWDLDKAISFAEKLWHRLNERGHGEPQKTGPREIARAYDKLNPIMKTAFDLFWLAFDYKRGKDEAAAAWLQLGEQTKNQYDAIIKAAKHAAQDRKNLPAEQVPIMAQGWLNKRRWLDIQTSGVEQQHKKTDEKHQQIQKITGELNHAKNMLQQTGDDYWHTLADTLTDQLKQLRSNP